jgi:hypothetical protein
VVRICSTSTARARSAETPNSTTSGTPPVARNASAAMPLSMSSTPTIWEMARCRVAARKNPISTTARPTGVARADADGANATSGRAAA